jgi:hypothetical protein
VLVKSEWVILLPIRPQARDGILIAGVGVLVAGSPVIWTNIVWPDQVDPVTPGAWLFLFAFSILPFGLVALQRATGVIRRGAAAVATVVAVSLVVIGQAAGLNPDDPSSTASIAVVIVPFYAVFAALVIWGADHALAALVSSWRSRRAP